MGRSSVTNAFLGPPLPAHGPGTISDGTLRVTNHLVAVAPRICRRVPLRDTGFRAGLLSVGDMVDAVTEDSHGSPARGGCLSRCKRHHGRVASPGPIARCTCETPMSRRSMPQMLRELSGSPDQRYWLLRELRGAVRTRWHGGADGDRARRLPAEGSPWISSGRRDELACGSVEAFMSPTGSKRRPCFMSKVFDEQEGCTGQRGIRSG